MPRLRFLRPSTGLGLEKRGIHPPIWSFIGRFYYLRLFVWLLPALISASLNQALEESLLACYGEFAQKGIQPIIEITNTPVRCRIDPSAFNRIVSNILSNVLKYSDGDLSVRLTSDGTIVFINTARNLTPVIVERLFDRFYTVETGCNSTGLGLSIAKALTERVGGQIWALYNDQKLMIELKFPVG